MADSIVYVCGVCQQQLASADFVVQTVKIEEIHPVDGSTREVTLVGEWFHAGCWGDGSAPFREIDRGPLAEVLARS
jgi:hypothetical protein